jgi:hypothetical protein
MIKIKCPLQHKQSKTFWNVTDRHAIMVSIPASNWGGPGLEPWTGDRLPFRGFPYFVQANAGIIP